MAKTKKKTTKRRTKKKTTEPRTKKTKLTHSQRQALRMARAAQSGTMCIAVSKPEEIMAAIPEGHGIRDIQSIGELKGKLWFRVDHWPVVSEIW